MYEGWVDESTPIATHQRTRVLTERTGTRATALGAISTVVASHFFQIESLEALGFQKVAEAARDHLPMGRRVRSGDLGEILGSEYASQKLQFTPHFQRLRHKEVREQPMRGDDIFALAGPRNARRLLKGECKSRAWMDVGTLRAARKSLNSNGGRPSQQTLLFAERVLRTMNRIQDAKEVRALFDEPVPLKRVEHLLFAFCGNDPKDKFEEIGEGQPDGVRRHLIGLRITDHQAFIAAVFEELNARAPN